MHSYPELTQWLAHLSLLLPSKQALLIGAGRGDGEWVEWLKQQPAMQTTLIEADTEAYPALLKAAENQTNWHAYHDLIAESTGDTTFFTASLSSESGLLQPNKLAGIWPNIETVQQQTRAALSLEDFTYQNALHPDWLFINCFAAQSLLQKAESVLQHVNIIIARASHDIDSLPEADLANLTQQLTQHAFTLIATEPGRHNHIVYALFVKNHAACYADLVQAHKQQKHKSKQKHKQTKQHNTKLTKQLQQAQQQLQEADEKNQKQQANEAKLIRQIAQLQQTLDAKESCLQKEQEHSLLHKKKLDKLDALLEQSAHIAAAMESQNQELAKQQQQWLQHIEKTASNRPSEAINPAYSQKIDHAEKNLRQTIQQSTGNAVAQLEAYIAIHNYFNTGSLLSGFHGWPISPDIGLFIINQMRRKQYDLIIEFGSGTSTLLFAKLAAAQHHEKLMSDLLPQKIVSFDHHADYYRQTQELLKINQMGKYVDLVHAPLIEWQENKQTFLYYDCEAKLQQLAQTLNGKQAKILVLVDGPPGNTCKNARYPAVPLLFKHLAAHQIDIILDDAARAEEKEVAMKWQALLNVQKINFTDTSLNNEKGIYFIAIDKH